MDTDGKHIMEMDDVRRAVSPGLQIEYIILFWKGKKPHRFVVALLDNIQTDN